MLYELAPRIFCSSPKGLRMTAPIAAPAVAVHATRVRVFVDYWNFQLSINEREGGRFQIDWRKIGPWLAAKACGVANITNHTFDGVIIYTSYNPVDAKFKRWIKTWLDRQPGVNVEARERKPRGEFRCPACHDPIVTCPHCNERIKGTIEKGVDTLIATDMIRLAWEGVYDLAVLATLDSDLVPAVEFLNSRGHKVIQAGFPPKGIDLATACWGSFDVYPSREEIRRP
jgi:uncharacterized LabA/DUF88 family protein